MRQDADATVPRIVETLTARRAKLAEEIERLDRAVAALVGGVRRGRPPGRGKYADAIEAVLNQASRQAMRPRDILAKLSAGGTPVRGLRPHTTLWNTLSTSPRFVKMPGGWGLRKWTSSPSE